MIEVRIISDDKKQFLELLLLADEEVRMIDRYLERGDMFALYDKNDAKSICVVTYEEDGVYEIKNLATYPESQRMGYASYLIEFVFNFYKEKNAKSLLVGTGYGTSTVSFYKKCNFKEAYVIKNFFTNNYSNPIIEDGVLLVDMICLRREI